MFESIHVEIQRMFLFENVEIPKIFLIKNSFVAKNRNKIRSRLLRFNKNYITIYWHMYKFKNVEYNLDLVQSSFQKISLKSSSLATK